MTSAILCRNPPENPVDVGDLDEGSIVQEDDLDLGSDEDEWGDESLDSEDSSTSWDSYNQCPARNGVVLNETWMNEEKVTLARL